MNPRIRAYALVPCLLAVLGLAAPAQAATSWTSMVTAFSTPSCSAADTAAGTTAHDTTAAPLPGWHTTGSVTLTGDQGTAGMEYMIDCRNPTSAPIGAEIFAPEGPHTISHRAVDQANPTLATPWVHETVNVDSTAPVNTTSDYSSGWHKGIVNVAVTGTSGPSGIAHADWTLDGTTRSGSSGAIVPISGDADHAFTSSVTNGAGVATTPRTDTIRIDDGAPTDSTTYPVGWQYTPTTIDLYGADSRSGVDHVEWKLDGATPPNTGDNHTLIDMPEGTHTLDTQIVDNAGNASGFVRHTVSVDLTGPQDTTTVPAGWVTGPQTITVKGTDTGGAGITSVEWDLDNGERHGGGANNQTVQINDDRDHILQTRVTDGKPGGWTAWKTQHVKIDSVVPADVTSVSSGWQRTALAVDITGTDGMSGVEHVEWQLAGPVNSSGTSTSNPKTITISGDGTYTLNTRVFDNAGLHTGWSPHTIRIDTTSPANLTALPPSTWISGPYSVYVNGSDGGSGFDEMHWSIDGAPAQHGPAGTPVTVSGTGQHHLVSWATDVAGNASGQRDDVITLDGLPPTDTTAAPTGSVANHSTVAVTGTDAHSGIDHVTWKLDDDTDAEAQSGPSGSLAKIDGPGPHTLWTRVYDKAGNSTGWKQSTVTVDVSGDVTPPTDTSTTVRPEWYTDSSVTLTVSATDASSGVAYVQWRIGTAIQRGSSGASVTITGEGPHMIETRARDTAGNYSAWRAQWVRIDSVQPVDTSDLPDGWTNTKTFTLKGTDGTSGMGTMDYMVDGATIASTVAAGATIPALADGTHTIVHRAVDVAGQASDWVTDTVKIDTVAPVNTSAPAPNGWVKSFFLPITGTDTASGSGSVHGEFIVDGGDPQPGPAVITADGTHTLQTYVVDAAGNASAMRSETVKIDSTPPVNTTVGPSAPWLRSSFTTTVSGTDGNGSGVTQLQWTLDGAAQTGSAVTVAATGAHQLRTRVGDAAGNWSDWRADTVGIDRTAPALTVDCGSDAWRAAPVTCAVAGDGGESGLGSLTVARNGGAAKAIASGAGYSVADDGDYTLTIRAADIAGNTAATTAHVRVDRTAPAVGLDCAADAGSAYTCRASGADGGSGVASLTYSVDGGVPVAVTPGSAFTVAKGRVVVRAADVAGNAANSRALILSDRVVPFVPRPRTVSEAVLRSGRGSAVGRAVGEISLASTPDRSSVDLRPLAVGKGRFQITLKLRTDKRRKTYTKVVNAARGYTPRISVRTGGAASVTVDLTIRRRLGKRWVAYASGGAEL